MQNKIFRFGPVALSTTLTANLLNPPAASGGVNAGSSPQYIILKHLRIVNRSGAVANFSLWLGASGANVAGTEIVGQSTQVAVGGSVDWYGLLRLDSTDFLVGGASAANALTIQGEGEIGVAG